MKLTISKSANSEHLYIQKSFRNPNGKSTTKTVKKLGEMSDLLPLHNYDRQQVILWAKELAKEMTIQEQQDQRDIVVTFSNAKKIEKNSQNRFNVGYLFLSSLFHSLKLDQLSQRISKDYKFEYSLSDILHDLIICRILYPSSKRSTYTHASQFLKKKSYQLEDVYRALDVLYKEDAQIQQFLYQQSHRVVKRNTQVLYYDVTNFFFEIQESQGLKQYGRSKENRPNPIIQMGLFLDGSGIPLAYSVHPGNTNEQLMLKPLEKQIIHDFQLSKFVVCTDAGLSSRTNKLYNSFSDRGYITVQSLKKLKTHLRQWALDPTGWKLPNQRGTYTLEEAMNPEEDLIYYKERWINENGLEERLIISFSPSYQRYQRMIRNQQIERALNKIDSGQVRKGKNQNDPARFITQTCLTQEGEVATQECYSLDVEKIHQEQQTDGFYGIVTNINNPIQEIIKVNKRRWEIEETFRIMKEDFRSRPAHVQTDEHIIAHFNTCFLAVTLYRLLEKKLNEHFSVIEILDTLRNMDVVKVKNEGYIPTYTRNDLTDKLIETFGLSLDTEIIDAKQMKKIIRKTKNKN